MVAVIVRRRRGLLATSSLLPRRLSWVGFPSRWRRGGPLALLPRPGLLDWFSLVEPGLINLHIHRILGRGLGEQSRLLEPNTIEMLLGSLASKREEFWVAKPTAVPLDNARSAKYVAGSPQVGLAPTALRLFAAHYDRLADLKERLLCWLLLTADSQCSVKSRSRECTTLDANTGDAGGPFFVVSPGVVSFKRQPLDTCKAQAIASTKSSQYHAQIIQTITDTSAHLIHCEELFRN